MMIMSGNDTVLLRLRMCQSANTSDQGTEIDEKVFDLYGLTPEEREIVKENGKREHYETR